MDLNDFTTLLSTYGTIEANWPEPMREAARKFADSNTEAAALLSRYRALDDAMSRYEVPLNQSKIRAGIMARINAPRPGIIDRVAGWLFPDLTDLHAIWRPALAATLPLVIGIILGSTISIDTTADKSQTWNDEISMVALSDNDLASDSESLP